MTNSFDASSQSLRRVQNDWQKLGIDELVHNIKTDFGLIEEIAEATKLNFNGLTILTANLEIAVVLIHKYNAVPSDITIFADYCPTTQKIAAKLGINYIDAWNYNMKFDVVFANPPYDGGSYRNVKLWAKFSRMFIDLNPKTIACITPNNMVSNKGQNGKDVRNYAYANGYGFTSVRNHDENPFKGVGVNTCHWIISKDSEDLVDPILIDEEIVIDPIAQRITDKVVSYAHKLPLTMENGFIAKGDLTETGKEIYFSGNKLKYAESVEGEGILKVVLPFSSSYHKAFITNKACGMLNLVYYAKDQQEAEFVLNYIQSKLFKLVASIYKKTSGFTPFVKNQMVPDLRGLDTNKLYEIFDLSEDEIEFIENDC